MYITVWLPNISMGEQYVVVCIHEHVSKHLILQIQIRCRTLKSDFKAKAVLVSDRAT